MSVPDLIVAAVAERHGVSIVHHDEDYDRIAALTGQPVRWVVPRGSVPLLAATAIRSPYVTSVHQSE